ncbi:hypothetical protein BD289DRAFT_202366 [Coniella lustricola]|uniref:Uncharacterized protein n=1 Tax=Coniella lustricola TaxID=2025994 RepID=A0A2T3ACM0_9PEZI|nr:hypothetical protein BD289DRAFT_202366 [Coniella lustricola]
MYIYYHPPHTYIPLIAACSPTLTMLLYTVCTVTYLSVHYSTLENLPPLLQIAPNNTAFALNTTANANTTHSVPEGGALQSEAFNQRALLGSFLVSIYIVGVIFALLWILTRTFDRKLGPHWVPGCFRTDACCIWLEPVARFAPAFVWPLFIFLCFIYHAKEKSRDAATCCGRRRRIAKQQARLRSVMQPNYDVCDSTSELVEPKPPRWLSIARSSTSSPAPSYHSKVAPFVDHAWSAKQRQSSGSTSPQSSTRSSSVGSCSSCHVQSYFQPMPSPLRHQSAPTQPITIHVNTLSVIVGDEAGSSRGPASMNGSIDSRGLETPREVQQIKYGHLDMVVLSEASQALHIAP